MQSGIADMADETELARWRRAEVVFCQLREMPAEARAARLAELAGTDASVASLVQSLLEQDAAGLRELDEPAALIGLRTAPALPEGDFGSYELLAPLGQGRAGMVYRARQRTLDREVAVKVLSIALFTGQSARRFANEVRALRTLRHPNIAAILDAGTVRESGGMSRPYFAMELVKGERITEHVGAAALSIDQRLQLVLQLCDAVSHAHRHGVLHRDLSPANVLVERDTAGEARVRVIDFGLARFLDTDEPGTMQGIAHGTPGFMSPEQQRGDSAAIDTRTDVYSVGALLLALIGPGAVPRDLALIARTATQHEPDDRYQTVDAMADDLRRYLAHRPISARSSSLPYLLSRYARRHPAQASVIAGCVALLAVAAVVVAVSWRRVASSERQVEAASRTMLHEVCTLMANHIGHFDDERRLLESLLPQFEALAAKRGDDPSIQADCATLLGRLGDSHAMALEHRQALELWTRAEALRADAARAQPDDPPALAEHAKAMVRVGNEASVCGDMPRRDAQYAAAQLRIEQGLQRWPNDARLVSDLAYAHERAGDLAMSAGDVAGALRHADRQVELAQRVATIEGDTQRALWDQASAHGMRALALEWSMRDDAAAAERLAALRDYQALAERFPGDREAQVRLASTLVAIAAVADAWTDTNVAALLAPAQRAMDTIVASDPQFRTVLPIRAALAVDRAPQRLARGDVEGALADIDRVLDEATRPTRSDGATADTTRAISLAFAGRARVLKHLGRLSEAEAMLRMATERLTGLRPEGGNGDPELLALLFELVNLRPLPCDDPAVVQLAALPLQHPANWPLALHAMRALHASGCEDAAQRVRERLQAAIPADLDQARARLSTTAGGRVGAIRQSLEQGGNP